MLRLLYPGLFLLSQSPALRLPVLVGGDLHGPDRIICDHAVHDSQFKNVHSSRFYIFQHRYRYTLS